MRELINGQLIYRMMSLAEEDAEPLARMCPNEGQLVDEVTATDDDLAGLR